MVAPMTVAGCGNMAIFPPPCRTSPGRKPLSERGFVSACREGPGCYSSRGLSGPFTMTKPERTPLAGMAFLGVGFSFAAIVGVMSLLGHLLDEWLGTEPWLLVLLAMVGVAYATMDLIRVANALGRRKKDADG